ncbi:MAG: hypothetical protein K2K79_05040 [Paramuribaculum sp.]|nr:hypothetical protein [Paramuribaculum sp.]
MRLINITCVAATLLLSGCTDRETSIKEAVEATDDQCPYEIAVGVELKSIDITPEGDVRLVINAPATIADSSVMAYTLNDPDRQAYWLDQVLPPHENAEFINNVKECGHDFIFVFETSDGKTVTKKITPQ